MILGRKLHPATTTMMRAGMIALLVFFGMSRWFLRPVATLAQDVIDLLAGAALGVAIGSVFLALWLKRNRA